MKIVNLCGPNPLDVKISGGVGQVVYNINKELKAENFDITTIAYGDVYLNKETEMGKLIVLSIPNLELLRLILYPIKAALLCRKLDPKIVVSEGGSSLGAGLFFSFFKRKKTILIERAHGTHYGLLQQTSQKTLHMRIFGFLFANILERFSFKRADKIISVSKFTKSELIKFFSINEHKISVIYNGVDNTLFKRATHKEKRSLRRSLGLMANKKYLLFIGLDPLRKGLDIAIAALSYLNNKNVYLNVIGNPKNFSTQNKNVFFLGKIGQKRKLKYYKLSDIFLFPSRHEGFSLVCMEALSSGLPLIVSKYSGTNEIITNKKNGIVIGNLDPKRYARAIEYLLDKQNDKIGCASIKLASKYSWKNVSKTYVKFYKSL